MRRVRVRVRRSGAALAGQAKMLALLSAVGCDAAFVLREVHVLECGGGTMLATFAFDVCHDVYRSAREVIDTKIPTLNLESSGKYTWHPDRLPRLAEYVA